MSAPVRTLSLSSKFILGTSPTPETEQALRLSTGWVPGDGMSMSVFEVRIDQTVRYCCWAGGKLLEDPAGIGGIMPHLTLAGMGACEAMMRLPCIYGRDGECLVALVFHGVALGKTPLREKVMTAFRKTADVDAVICFVGDLAGELDGHMGKAFNIKGMVDIGDIAGMTPHGRPRQR